MVRVRDPCQCFPNLVSEPVKSANSFHAAPHSIPFHPPSEKSRLQAGSPVSETMVHTQATADAVTQAGSEVRVWHVFLTEFDRLFKMKEQFTEGSFGSISTAVSIVERKMVMIKNF